MTAYEYISSLTCAPDIYICSLPNNLDSKINLVMLLPEISTDDLRCSLAEKKITIFLSAKVGNESNQIAGYMLSDHSDIEI